MISPGVPVIIMTSSEQEADLARRYLEGANSYITKPIRFTEFVEKIRELKLSRALVNKLPPESAFSSSALEVT